MKGKKKANRIHVDLYTTCLCVRTPLTARTYRTEALALGGLTSHKPGKEGMWFSNLALPALRRLFEKYYPSFDVAVNDVADYHRRREAHDKKLLRESVFFQEVLDKENS